MLFVFVVNSGATVVRVLRADELFLSFGIILLSRLFVGHFLYNLF